jgi:DNA-binding GntR family transcriptional regulator
MPDCIQCCIMSENGGFSPSALLAQEGAVEVRRAMASTRRNSTPAPPLVEPPVSSSDLGQQILRKLRERILNWHYPPGHHLGEQALCDELDASRIPVREALRALAEQGLVDKVPNQGCYVKQPDAEATHHLYDMRLALELFVVERLAHTGLPADVLEKQRAYWEPLLHIRAHERFEATTLVEADEAFHLSLARAVDNPYIFEALQDINDRLRFVRLAVLTTPHRVQTTAGEHLIILEALEKKDAEAARRSLRQNINQARNKVEIAIGRALAESHKRRT